MSSSPLSYLSHPGWINLDSKTFLANLYSSISGSMLVDLSIPVLRKTRTHFEDEFIRAGISGFVSDDANSLLAVEPSLLRILKKNAGPETAGYATKGIVPVLFSLTECLSLSNLAQTLDRRIGFYLLCRSLDETLGAGNCGLYVILDNLTNLPMIDLHGMFFDLPQSAQQLKKATAILAKHQSIDDKIIQPAEPDQDPRENLMQIVGWETLGIGKENQMCFCLEIGFWLFPVEKTGKGMLFQADVGALNGLPLSFPVQINGRNAEVISVELNKSFVFLPGFFEGPYPVKAYLSGGNLHNLIDIKNWKAQELKTFISLADNFQVRVV